MAVQVEAPGARPPLFARPELLALVALAAVTRFWALDTPHAVVFDEALYQNYIAQYYAGNFYFNVHPPAGKLILSFVAQLIGLDPIALAKPLPAPALRAIPALAGTAIIPLFWLLLRQLGASRVVATFGAGLLIFDNALLSVSRLVLIDSLLIAFMLGAVTAFLANRFALSGVLLGLAACTKWTGLGAAPIIVFLWLQRGRRPRPALVTSGMAAAAYVIPFAIHFALLPLPGTGDKYMSEAFRAGERSFVRDFADAHRGMVAVNAEIAKESHPAASPWWSWPILKTPIYAYQDDGRHVLIEGNPVLWWGILAGLAALGVLAMHRPADFADRRAALLVLLGAWLANWLPFAAITRHLFIYSYLPAMIFSLGLVVLGLGANRRPAVYATIGALVLGTFLYFSPLTYGAQISDEAFARRMWLLERH